MKSLLILFLSLTSTLLLAFFEAKSLNESEEFRNFEGEEVTISKIKNDAVNFSDNNGTIQYEIKKSFNGKFKKNINVCVIKDQNKALFSYMLYDFTSNRHSFFSSEKEKIGEINDLAMNRRVLFNNDGEEIGEIKLAFNDNPEMILSVLSGENQENVLQLIKKDAKIKVKTNSNNEVLKKIVYTWFFCNFIK